MKTTLSVLTAVSLLVLTDASFAADHLLDARQELGRRHPDCLGAGALDEALLHLRRVECLTHFCVDAVENDAERYKRVVQKAGVKPG